MAKLWSMRNQRKTTHIRTVEVIYECGCEVKLHAWGPQHAEVACKIHTAPIGEIITREKWLRLGRDSGGEE